MLSRSNFRLGKRSARGAHIQSRFFQCTARRSISVISWMLGIGVVLASAAWIFSGLGWRVDLIANLTAQIGVVALLLLLFWAALRKWRLVACVAFAFPLLVMALAPGRAERGSIRDDTLVRVLSFNTYNKEGSRSLASDILAESDADVFTIIEPNPEVVRLIRETDSFRERYPYVWPTHPYMARQTIVSRWPIEGLSLRNGTVKKGQPNPGAPPTGVIIRRPNGAFVLIATHPISPRSPQSWENGNESIRRLALIIADLARSQGLPIVVGGDFNSTPTGWRSRHLHQQTGLLRGKPWLIPTGSWPSGTVWPARLAIDDVFVSSSIRVLSWKTLPAADGGDHSPVRIELLIPFVLGAEPNDDTNPPNTPH